MEFKIQIPPREVVHFEVALVGPVRDRILNDFRVERHPCRGAGMLFFSPERKKQGWLMGKGVREGHTLAPEELNHDASASLPPPRRGLIRQMGPLSPPSCARADQWSYTGIASASGLPDPEASASLRSNEKQLYQLLDLSRLKRETTLGPGHLMQVIIRRLSPGIKTVCRPFSNFKCLIGPLTCIRTEQNDTCARDSH